MPAQEIPFFPRVTAWVRSVAADIKHEFRPWHLFALLGVLFVLYIVERAVDFIFFHFATPWKPLAAYRRRGPKPTYALVTGASAGIGLGIARALVRQGFGVILLGHKPDELAAAAESLRQSLVLPEDADPAVVSPDEYVKVVVMDAMTATPEEMETGLREVVVDGSLRVSILVNNVGSVPIAPPTFRTLATYSPDDIDDSIALNVRFPARLTTLMLPVLAHRGAGVDDHGMSFGTHRRSLILNVGSGDMLGVPYLVVHGATKSFNYSFSKGLARELEMDPKTRHVDVLAVVPGDVQSQGNSVVLSRWTPDSETFGKWVVEKADGAIGRGWRDMRPHWLHHLQNCFQPLVSERVLTRGIQNIARSKRDIVNELHSIRSKDE